MSASDKAHQDSLAPGAWVTVEGMAGIAQILEIDGRRKRVRVRLGDHEWVVALKRLSPAEPPQPREPAPRRVRVIGGSAPQHEIDLHGLRVEDALEATERALDQAVVHHLGTIKVIHGHGSGAVRHSVRRLLAGHRYVAEYRFGSPMEGGLACTVVRLKTPGE